MIITPDLRQPYIGETAPTLFGQNKSGPAPIPDIDLTSPTLDSRVQYNGPAHAYWGSDGKLYLSNANEYPLEYSNGVPIGRHEPERASVNFITDRDFAGMSAPGGAGPWIQSGSPTPVVTPPGTLPAGQIPYGYVTVVAGWNILGVYDVETAAFIAGPTSSPVSHSIPDNTMLINRRVSLAYSKAAAGSIRYYPTRLNSTNYLYGLFASIPSGQAIFSEFYSEDGTNRLTGLCQAEAGSLATSPFTGNRAVSTVWIDTGGASSLTVHYSDGTEQDYNINGSAQWAMLQSTKNWAERYVQRISFTR